MSDVIRIWVETSHNAALRCGGWAYVLAEGSALSGAAGGERTPSSERMALAGLVEALKDVPAKAGLEVLSAQPLILETPRRLAAFAAGEEPPEDNVELWAQLSKALKEHQATFRRVINEPRTPTAFAAAWTDLARDKAKASGAFRAPIPKSNLAKAGV
jgi:ribonuclease HI